VNLLSAFLQQVCNIAVSSFSSLSSSSNSLDLSGNKTHAAWVYMNSSYGGTGLLGKADSSVAGMAFSYGWGGGGFQNIAWNSTNNPSLTAVASDINNWYYIVGVQDGSTRYIYVIGANGTRVVTHDGGTHSWNNSLNYTIGAVAGYYTNMRIGAVHIYNRALSSAEIVQNYNATKSRFSLGGQSLFNGVTQYLDFSKTSSYPGSGTDLLDISGNGFHDSITSAAAVTTIDGVRCLNCANGSQINGNLSNTPTLGNNYTILCWARVISSTSEYRTLFRTYDDDHPLLVETGSNRIGYYDNNGGNFVYSGLDVGTLGLAERWVLYTIVGSGGNTQTFYINDGTNSGSVNYNATGEQMDDICNHFGQIFGPVSSSILYNNQAFTQAQVKQYFDATKQYHGYTSDNIPSYGLVMNLDAGDPISYPGSGTVWYDTTGNGNNVNLTNGPSFVPITNGGYFANDVDSYFTGSGTPTIPIGNSPYTMLVWARQKSANGWQFAGGFISIGGYYTTNQSNALRTLNATVGHFHHYWWGNDLSLENNNAGLALDTWFMVAATFDGTTRRIWVNGVSRASDTPSGHNVTDTTIQVSKTVANEYQIGDVAVARIYNRALTSSEMLGIFNTEKSRFGL
jgi:hypothetical protein